VLRGKDGARPPHDGKDAEHSRHAPKWHQQVHRASTARRSWCRRRWSLLRSVSRTGSGLRVMVGDGGERRLLNRLAEGQGGGEGGGNEAPLRTLPTAGTHAAPAAHEGKEPHAGGRRQREPSGGEGGEPPPTCLAGGKGGKSSTVERGIGETAAGVPRRRQARQKRNGSRGGGVAAGVPRRRQGREELNCRRMRARGHLDE